MAKIQDLAQSLSKKHKIQQKEAERFLSQFVEVLNNGLHYEKMVKVKGLGTFKIVETKERESVNVNTGERIIIEGRPKITFTPDAVMKDLVNKPFAQFETVALNDGVDFEDVSAEQKATEEVTDPGLAEALAEQTGEPEEMPIETPLDEPEDMMPSMEPEHVATAQLPLMAGNSEPLNNEEPEPTELSVEEEETSVSEIPQEVSENASVAGFETPKEEPMAEPEASEETFVVEPEKLKEEIKTESATSEKPAEEEKQSEEPAPKTEKPTLKENVSAEEKDKTKKEPYNWDTKSENKKKKTPWLVWILGVAAAALVLYFCGFHFGKTLRDGEKETASKTTQVSADTVMPQAPAEERPATQTETPKSEQQPATTPAKDAKSVEPAAPASDADMKRLNSAKNIVRTGAYKILGTQESVTVRSGQTLEKISKHYFGPGLEAYVMVHNGITQVKEGMTVNIPKLEVKKK